MDCTARAPAPCVTAGESASGAAGHRAPHSFAAWCASACCFISRPLLDTPAASVWPTALQRQLRPWGPGSSVTAAPCAQLSVIHLDEVWTLRAIVFTARSHAMQLVHTQEGVPVKPQVSCRKLSQAGAGQESSGCRGHPGGRGPQTRDLPWPRTGPAQTSRSPATCWSVGCCKSRGLARSPWGASFRGCGWAGILNKSPMLGKELRRERQASVVQREGSTATSTGSSGRVRITTQLAGCPLT